MTEIQPLLLWTAAALLVLLLIISIVAFRRSGSFASGGALFGVAALVVIAFATWNFAEHSILRQRTAEREALDARALQLTAAAMAPGSALACLDAGAGEVVEASCEAAVFLKPETVAAATAYMEAKLRLLVDGLEYAHRTDRTYYNALAQMRRVVEADRYGFVAYVLMTRDGCTADSCGHFGWLRDAGAVKANMNARTLEDNIARYAGTWSRHKSSPAAGASPLEAPPVAALMSGPVMTKPIDFPTAASIPPVSIMTETPAAPAPAEAAPARRQPAPGAATARPQ
ncbi:MAG TPA: hypothetical protein VFK79_17610 [Xanthobacteraceae bacterium]|nr:hypothetical protein [Xanthobacteraceae bacterium]